MKKNNLIEKSQLIKSKSVIQLYSYCFVSLVLGYRGVHEASRPG